VQGIVVADPDARVHGQCPAEREQLKVTLDPPTFHRAAYGNSLEDTVRLNFYEYRLGSGDNALESYVTRWGLDL